MLLTLGTLVAVVAGAAVTLFLAVYLCIALFSPERFQ